jgi:hypothetical protein
MRANISGIIELPRNSAAVLTAASDRANPDCGTRQMLMHAATINTAPPKESARNSGVHVK